MRKSKEVKCRLVFGLLIAAVVFSTCKGIVVKVQESFPRVYAEATASENIECVEESSEVETSEVDEFSLQQQMVKDALAEVYARRAADNSIEAYSVNTDIIWFTSPVTGVVTKVNVAELMDAYYYADASSVLGYKEALVLLKFLVEDMGVHKNIACAIIGNCSREGRFGEEQDTGIYINSLDEARALLTADTEGIGYGIVQWTTPGRRELLLKYYEEACYHLPVFEEAQIVAELMCLYEELQTYELFTNYDQVLSIEDACGRIALKYEAYKDSNKDWSMNSAGVCSLERTNCSGAKRLAFAYRINDLLKEK